MWTLVNVLLKGNQKILELTDRNAKALMMSDFLKVTIIFSTMIAIVAVIKSGSMMVGFALVVCTILVYLLSRPISRSDSIDDQLHTGVTDLGSSYSLDEAETYIPTLEEENAYSERFSIDEISAEDFLKVPLLSPAESRFFYALQDATPEHLMIFTKVALGDLIKPRLADSNSRESYFKYIRTWHVDFVLYHKAQDQVVLCIELDDSSHDRWNAEINDSKKNELLTVAGYKLLRVPCRRGYVIDDLRADILESL